MRNLVCSFLLFQQEEEGMVAGFSLRAILGYLNSDDINGLQGGVRLTKARYKYRVDQKKVCSQKTKIGHGGFFFEKKSMTNKIKKFL